MTKEELSALPEFNDYEEELLPTGEKVLHRKVPKFRSYKTKGDDVLLFNDEQGSWVVEYHYEGGPHKRRVPL